MDTLVDEAKPEHAAPPPDELGLSIADLVGNEAAIRILANSYRRHQDETASLRNEINTLRTYVAAYESVRTNTTIAAVLLVVSNISVGFAVGLLSRSQTGMAGWYLLLTALGLVGAGLYFTYFKDRR